VPRSAWIGELGERAAHVLLHALDHRGAILVRFRREVLRLSAKLRGERLDRVRHDIGDALAFLRRGRVLLDELSVFGDVGHGRA